MCTCGCTSCPADSQLNSRFDYDGDYMELFITRDDIRKVSVAAVTT